MSLTELWKKNPDQLVDKLVKQIIPFSGEGRLKDGSQASTEFRNFLSLISSELLQKYVEECLSDKFTDSGLALQDIVNQIGRRLGFDVTDGRYRGVTTEIGYDGLWKSPNNHTILVEVKTTDAFRIDLDVIAKYRKQLSVLKKIPIDNSSVLLIVGRSDTGDLEAQIRGSRHAWDMRLISVDALLRMMKIKEEVEDPSIIQRIHEILIPREFTKLDKIIDLLFSATEDIKQIDIAEDSEIGESKKPKFTPVSFHAACIKRIEKELGCSFLRQSQASFYTPIKDIGLICSISRLHSSKGPDYFWFGFYPHQRDFLDQYAKAFVAFGCGSENQILNIPFNDFKKWLDGFNITEKPDRFYWHVHISKEGDKFILQRKKGFEHIDISKYLML